VIDPARTITPADDAIRDAAARLAAGGVAAFPTETVYGLGADAMNAEAVARVFSLKGRPASNPLIVHVLDEAMARSVAAEWTADASRLARAYWPGPLTLVLPKAPRVPGVVTAGGASVAVRCPDHPAALALLAALGVPIVGPSANVSGAVSPTRAQHVRGVWPESDVLVLDGGPCRAGLESTVLRLGDEPEILRPGVIGAESIERVLGRSVTRTEPDDPSARGSPGRTGPHYRPRARVVLVDSLDDLDGVLGTGPCAVLTPPGEPMAVRPPHRVIDMPGGAHEYAAALYAALREADAMGTATIAVVRPPDRGSTAEETAIWAAVRERLGRASASEG